MLNIENLSYKEYERNFSNICIKYVKDYLKSKPSGLDWCTNDYFIKLYEYCLTLKSKETLYKIFYLIDYLESMLQEDLGDI